MPPLIRLTSEIREDFVAYLDGELDEQASERIEAVMAQSNVARNDVECLARAYELLEVLPRYEASADFAGQTLASIRVRELAPDFRETRWFRMGQRTLQAVLWITVLVIVMLTAFLTTRRGIPSDSDVLLRDLPMIEKLDAYTEVGSLGFLELLGRQDALLEEMITESRRDGGRDRAGGAGR